MSVSVPLDFIANFKNALNDFNGFVSDLDGKLGKVEKSFSKVERFAKAAIGAFAVKQVLDGIGNLIDAAADAEVQTMKMRNALKSAGDFSERNAAQFQRLADEIQNTTKFEGDLVLGQVAVAKQFGATNREAEKLIRAAVELSSRTGQDLNSSVELLGKSLDGTAGKLNELVPGMRELTAEQLAAGAAADLILEKFGGSAAAEIETFSGSIAQMKNNFGDLLEELGGLIVDNEAAVVVIREISKAFVALKEAIAANKGEFKLIVTDGINLAINSLGVLLQVVKLVDEAWTELARSLKFAIEPILNIPVALKNIAKLDFEANRRGTEQFNKELAQMRQEYEKRAAVYDKITAGVARISVAVEKNRDSQEKVTKEVIETAKGFDNLRPKVARINTELENGFRKIIEETKNIGATEIETVNNEYVEKIRLLQDYLKVKKSSETQVQDAIFKLTLKHDADVAKIRKKEREDSEKEIKEQADRIRGYYAEPLKIFFSEFQTSADILAASLGGIAQILTMSTATFDVKRNFEDQTAAIEEEYKKQNEAVDAALQAGTISLSDANKQRLEIEVKHQENIIKAEKDFKKQLEEAKKQETASAAKIIAGGIKTIANAYLPGLGEVVGPLFEALAQGPEKVGEMIKAFISAIPQVFENVVLAIPVVIEELAKGIPEIIERIADRLPDIIERLAEKAPDIAIAISKSLLISMPTAIIRAVGKGFEAFGRLLGDGAKQFLGNILEGAAKFVEEIIKGAGRFIQELIDGISGGALNPGGGSGFFNPTGEGTIIPGVNIIPDSVPIIGGWLKGGPSESDLNLQQNRPLKSRDESESSPRLSSGPTQLVIPIQMNKKELASAIVDLKRLGYRLEPA